MLRVLFGRRWLLATLLVLAAAGVMVRLGFWQLDRLAARQAYNARVQEQQAQPELMLDADVLDLDLYEMEYRPVLVRGEYVLEESIVLRNQSREGQLGVELFTPLIFEGTDQAILVQRGWIPAEQAAPADWQAFAEPGQVDVDGILRRAETDFAVGLRPDPTLAPGEDRLDAWNNLDLARIQAQSSVPLLDVYVQRLPYEQQSSPPYAQQLVLDLSEGPHLGYAGQWFLFAIVLLAGYPFYVRRQEQAAGVE
jgi:surfeit locus 1 family protein